MACFPLWTSGKGDSTADSCRPGVWDPGERERAEVCQEGYASAGAGQHLKSEGREAGSSRESRREVAFNA